MGVLSLTSRFWPSTKGRGLLLGAILTGALLAPATGWAQQAPSAVSVYSIWVQLSLRGFSQSEIESQLSNIDANTLESVRVRLRNTIISNLRLKQVDRYYQHSLDSDDVRQVREAIETEIRFAGLQNDPEILLQIQEVFGIQLNLL